MKRIFTSIIVLISFSINTYCQNDTIRVLFLGNSYTAVNQLPELTANLSMGTNKILIYDSYTPGGYTLEAHSTNPSALDKIRLGNWDYVVLQEQSQIPTIDYYRYNSMYPSAIRLNDTIKKYNPCANVVFFMTWGRRFGGQQCDETGTYCSPDFVDFSHMQDSLESAYVQIADYLNAYVSPVGIAWKAVIEDTTIVLHAADNSHPNFNGSYLAACVFYSVIWKDSPVGSIFTGSLPESLAYYFQQVANYVVFNSYSDWNLNIDQPTADFTFSVFADSVQFSNHSNSFEPVEYFWDFGDNTTSTLENPSHIYSTARDYTVTLIVKHCAKSDTIFKTVSIISAGNNQGLSVPDFNIYPNPFSDKLVITSKTFTGKSQIFIYNVLGEIMFEKSSVFKKKEILDLQELSSGIYFLCVRSEENNSQRTLKILKTINN